MNASSDEKGTARYQLYIDIYHHVTIMNKQQNKQKL